MPDEIEAKHLIYEDRQVFATWAFHDYFLSTHALREAAEQKGTRIVQGYLPPSDGFELANAHGLKVPEEFGAARIRESSKDGENRHYLTLKGKGLASRPEEECEIDASEFNKYWHLTEGRRVTKRRLDVECKPEGEAKLHSGLARRIEFDLFEGLDLIIAEIEVPDLNALSRLPLLGKDVTNDPNYTNVRLAR